MVKMKIIIESSVIKDITKNFQKKEKVLKKNKQLQRPKNEMSLKSLTQKALGFIKISFFSSYPIIFNFKPKKISPS